MKTAKNRKLNVRLLRKIQRHILEEPRRFIMQAFVWTKKEHGPVYTDDYGRQQRFAACGTAACIAGWAVILSRKKPPVNGTKVASLASNLLRLDYVDEQRLFLDVEWPEPFFSKYMDAVLPSTRAKIASERIDHFIKYRE